MDQDDAKRNDRKKRRESRGLYKSLGFRLILEQTKSCKKWRFSFSKILIQNENEKILRFDRQRNQKPNFYVCVSVWKKIWIHVCVSDLWTKRNLWFILCSLSHPFFVVCFCTFVFPLNPLVKSTVSWKTTPFRCRSRKIFLARKKQLQLFGAKNDCFFFGGTSKDKIDDRDKFILKRMKVSYDRYETLLHVVLL